MLWRAGSWTKDWRIFDASGVFGGRNSSPSLEKLPSEVDDKVATGVKKTAGLFNFARGRPVAVSVQFLDIPTVPTYVYLDLPEHVDIAS